MPNLGALTNLHGFIHNRSGMDKIVSFHILPFLLVQDSLQTPILFLKEG
jgi:hypothetical protein